jgi:2-polyprenyl-6-methoxyphenol hydroxylase-like FAD-dependent oxidoreductase
MARTREADVLVVGGGPVGLLAAVMLAARDLQVEIVDEAWRPATHGYALALHPASLRILEGLGLADDLVAQGQRIDRVAFYEGTDRRAEVDLSRLGGSHPFVLSLPQRTLETTLQDRLRQLGTTVRWNHRASRIDDAEDGLTVTVDRLDRTSSGYPVAGRSAVVADSSELRCRWVVGADGEHSLVRQHIGAAFDSIGEPTVFGVFEFAGSPPDPNEMRVVLDEGTSSGLWPLARSRCRWSLELPDTRLPRPRGGRRPVVEIGTRAFPQVARDHLTAMVRERAPWFTSEIEDIVWSIAVGFRRRLAEPLGSDRTWLAGDAAHTALPLGMHSMNAGLLEASRLAEHLTSITAGDRDVEALSREATQRGRSLRFLLGAGESTVALAEASAWVRERRDRIVPCLPATGEDLDALLRQLGLQRPG